MFKSKPLQQIITTNWRHRPAQQQAASVKSHEQQQALVQQQAVAQAPQAPPAPPAASMASAIDTYIPKVVEFMVNEVKTCFKTQSIKKIEGQPT